MSKSIYDYNFPEDLKRMNVDELDLLSYQIREFLIEKVSATGGHLAPNLGVVELSLALHKVFNSPVDKIIWDVGHQSYVHKILTGRAKGFDSLRTFGGMSGFPKVSESPHDVFDTGHSSTAISLAMGMAVSRDLNSENYEVVAVIGDGAMTGGPAFEGLNNISESGRKVTVILNDNGMSIAPNVGGLAKHLSNLRTSAPYLNAKKAMRQVANLPKIGDMLYNGMRSVKEHMKYALLPKGVLFEELGLTYLGPIDGHNLIELMEAMESAKKIDEPVLIHAITKKGKGYRSAELNPDKFHGVGKFDPCTGIVKKSEGKSYSSIAGESILELAKQHDNVVAVSAAMCEATGLGDFSKRYPNRFFDVGIAEAHGVTFSAGMAANGLRPVVAIYSSFLQRAYDQILEDVCIQNLPVIFAIDRAGVVGADGETHHGVFDIAYLSSMPNMTILTPNGEDQVREAFQKAYDIHGPVAIRYPRGECPKSDKGDSSSCAADKPERINSVLLSNEETDVLFRNERIAKGNDVDIWAVGRMVETGKKVVEKLSGMGIKSGLVDVKQVKPMDISLLDDDISTVITLEDGIENGGFGQQLAAKCSLKHPKVKVMRITWPDQFVEHGDIASLEKKYGMDADSITERIYEERKVGQNTRRVRLLRV